uniref:NADH-ubiquinone oxidoreductase chain 1 n=1 Tax=Haematopinus quadripertusus TaxID=1453187 RepID=A0AAU7YR43_9NEOP
MMFTVLISQMLIIIVSVLFAVAFFSLFERKLLSLSQIRKGPNKISLKGILQPIGDAIKLVTKLTCSPNLSNYFIYWLSPLFIILLTILVWIVMPLNIKFIHINNSGVLILTLMSLMALPNIFSGWYSNSSYSIMGAIRSVAQTISFEITLSFSLFMLFLTIQSFCMESFVHVQKWTWLCWFIPWLLIIILIAFLAESGRSPFDLPEGESELVSGYTIEYGGIHYTLIFLGENLAVMFMAMIMSHTMFGGTDAIKVALIVSLIVFIRSSFPRIRYDCLMNLNWIIILPTVIAMVWPISIMI